MQKITLIKKFSWLIFGMLLAWSPMLFVACSQAPPFVSSHTPPEDDLQETSLEKEIRTVMEKGISLDERKRQVPVIERAFARLANPERARNLAALCYFKTLGTPFSPLDLAEIALVETGGHRLSSSATSVKGAIGVWQLMPTQARSHGYSPAEMRNDEKCAEAAVRTLLSKLAIADGNMDRAKKFYCGVGPQADAYLRKLKLTRQALLEDLDRSRATLAANDKELSIQ
ncbi:MAG: lytic transglycosylase domain-containing protein [Geobacter sp.]|jgi:hypothetical protein|nr:lytic transglycosylase domain-containing protein [Geobacter sp.]